MAPLPGDIAPFRRRRLALHRHVVFGAMDMDRGMREVRHAASVIAVEMGQQHMAHVLGGIAECLHLLHRRLRRIEPWRGLPQPSSSQPIGRCDIAKSNAGIDQGEPVIGLH
ncbi:hypothetical protein ACVWXM_000534 [Bradyrhizobium sp. GM7.3]